MSGVVTHSAKESASLRFLYGTPAGRAVLKILTQPVFSVAGGAFLKMPLSTILIDGYIRKNRINMKRFARKRYRSFHDFFIRELKEKEFSEECPVHLLLAPCDGKASAYTISEENAFRIKNSVYTIGDLLEDEVLAKNFTGGTCVIFRLTPDDYHRYCYVDDGEILARKEIRGVLHTVRPIAHYHYPVFVRNSRVCTMMRTAHFGDVIQIEVGALMVGKIRNHKNSGSFTRGEEKGLFEFGGSTILLLFKEGAVQIKKDILAATLRGEEHVLRVGEVIGEKAEGGLSSCGL